MVTLDQGGLGRLDTAVVAAPSELADLVEHGFVRRDGVAVRPAGSWRIVPDPSANLVVVLRDTARGQRLDAVIVGARSRHVDIDLAGRRLTLGVRLRPGALPAIARVHAAELTDRAVPAADVFGAAWRGVVDRFVERDPHAALREILEVVGRAARTRRPDRAALAAAGAPSVAGLANALAMPLRTLHKRTLETIGLGPKRLLRILRIYRALDQQRRGAGWAHVAARAGFADQPHLVREFRALLGEAPGAWIARGARGRFLQDAAGARA